jgi:hypothetical protein
MWALEQILEHLCAKTQVWIARRDEIARHWLKVVTDADGSTFSATK